MGESSPPATASSVSHLRRTLGPLTLWGLGVGYVISGEYFGWNLGLPVGGTWGMVGAFLLATLMYVTFVFGYAEMACAIPRAGGVFVYAGRSLGPGWGFLGGIAQVVEFVFAPPAIAVGIGGYTLSWFDPPWVAALESRLPIPLASVIALFALLAFTLLNAWGVRQAAAFELAVATVAALGLLIFFAAAAPHVTWQNLQRDGWPHGWSGLWAALPFAMWFYLGIEGVANVAEEALHPQRDISWGFTASLATLIVLAAITLIGCVGVGGWPAVVYGQTPAEGGIAPTLDTPLPLAILQFTDASSSLYRAVLGIGLAGLFASLNGIVLAAGRAVFEMGRIGFFFRPLGTIHPRFQTPVRALFVNLGIGCLAILFCQTGALITLSAFGALTLYVVAMLALFRLRALEPDLPRPYRTPGYPWFPSLALGLALVCLAAIAYGNWQNDIAHNYTLWYICYLIAAGLFYRWIVQPNSTAQDLQHFRGLESSP